MEYFKAIFDLSKLPSKFFLLFSISSAIFLFAKPEWLEIVQVQDFKEKYGQYIGLLFIVSSVLVIINFGIWFQKYFSRKVKLNRYKKDFVQNIKMLDPQERSVIREFILNGQSSIEMPLDDPVVNGLINKNIIKINKPFRNAFILSGMNASLSLTKRADKLLELSDLDLSKNPTDEQIEFARNNRPNWTDN